jgi:hypothetical protein
MKMRHKVNLSKIIGVVWIFLVFGGFLWTVQYILRHELSIFGLSTNWTVWLWAFVCFLLYTGYQLTIGDWFVYWRIKVEKENKDGSFPKKED